MAFHESAVLPPFHTLWWAGCGRIISLLLVFVGRTSPFHFMIKFAKIGTIVSGTFSEELQDAEYDDVQLEHLIIRSCSRQGTYAISLFRSLLVKAALPRSLTTNLRKTEVPAMRDLAELPLDGFIKKFQNSRLARNLSERLSRSSKKFWLAQSHRSTKEPFVRPCGADSQTVMICYTARGTSCPHNPLCYR